MLETRPNGKDRNTTIIVDVQKEYFQMVQDRDSLTIESSFNKGNCNFKVNGDVGFSEAIKKQYRLDDDRLTMMRNYYQYLWLLPLKLQDEGTIIDDKVSNKDFFGKEALEIKVSYDPTVGKDLWYFYFHPSTYALIGYRFYHDESKNDGEYIILDGEVQSGKIRIPKERKWYMHKDDKYLGSDICEKLVFK